MTPEEAQRALELLRNAASLRNNGLVIEDYQRQVAKFLAELETAETLRRVSR